MDRNKHCFVLMPFKEDFNNPWEFAIKPAAEENGLEPFRVDDKQMAGGIITKDITRSIIKAELIIAEMTGQNPNVLYELGLAHSAKKRVIMITQKESDIPFDIKNIRYILYDVNHLKELHLNLSHAISVVMSNPNSEEYDFFPELKIITNEKERDIKRLREEYFELISLAHGIKVTTEPNFAYVFFNNRYVGIAPQTIHVNPYSPRNVLTVFALEHFEEYKVLTPEDLKFGLIHIKLEKRNPAHYPARVHRWLKYIRLQPDDVVIGRAIATYLNYIGEYDEAIAQQKELLKTCDNWSMLYNGIATAFDYMKKFDDAIIYYKKVKEIEYSYIGRFNLACIYCQMGSYEKCLVEINEILDTDQFIVEMFEINRGNPFDGDVDFDNIRNDEVYRERFQELCNKLYERYKIIVTQRR